MRPKKAVSAAAEDLQCFGRASRLSHQRLIKADLKLLERTRDVREDGLKMLDRLQERVGLGAGGWILLAAQKRANHVQAQAQTLAQAIKRIQREQSAQRFDGGFE